MSFPYDSTDLDAIDKLANYYNNNVYNAATNPGGFRQGGHLVNFINSLGKAAIVAAAISAAATAAGNSATNAATSETNALAYANKLSGTSATSNIIGTGSKTFTTQASKFFNVGAYVNIRSAANPTLNFMIGQVTAYSGTGLTVNVTVTGGSGTYTDWQIDLSASPGQTGATGAMGTTGPTPAVQFSFSSGTTDSDPGNGLFKISSATFSAVTFIYFDNVETLNNTDVTAWLDALDDSTNTTNRGRLYMFQYDDPTKFCYFKVTGAVVDGSGYRKVPVTPLTASSASIPFTNLGRIGIDFSPSGDKGLDGAGAGDVVGPSGATDTAIVIFDGTTGKLVKNSSVGISTTGANVGKLNGDNTYSGASSFTGTVAYSNTLIGTIANANALVVGPSGATNPTLKIDTATASAATGLKITSAAVTGGLAVAVISSGTDENLKLDAKGGGTIRLNTVGTGAVLIGSNNLQMTPDGSTKSVLYAPSGFVTSSLFAGEAPSGLTHGSGNEGYYNAGFGFRCLSGLTTGNYNCGFGFETLENCTTGIGNSGYGEATLHAMISGTYNTAFGWKALLVQTVGDYNTCLGASSGIVITGDHNTGCGAFSLTATTTGTYNVACGYDALGNITTGTLNTGIGPFAGLGVTTGSYNTIIGNATGLSAALSSTIIVADGAGIIRLYSTASATTIGVGLGVSGTTTPALTVDYSAGSAATGAKITTAAAAGRLAFSVTSSGTDEGLSIDAKGAGTIRLGATSTGAIEFSRNAVPTVTAGSALGTTALAWSNLFLGAGAVINFSNGDVTFTHTTGVLNSSGALKTTSTTASTSTSTGSGIFAGGIGVAGKAYIGGALNVTDTTASTSTTTGSAIISGGLGVAGATYHGGALNMSYATPVINMASTTGTGFIYFLNSGTETNAMFASSATFFISTNAAHTHGVLMAANADAWSALSDARLPYKRKARLIDDRLPSLEGFHIYENEVENRLDIFVKAQEFHKLFPHVVTVGSDDPNYVPTNLADKDAWRMTYDRTGIIAMAYAKQHESELERLRARIEVLESRLH